MYCEQRHTGCDHCQEGDRSAQHQQQDNGYKDHCRRNAFDQVEAASAPRLRAGVFVMRVAMFLGMFLNLAQAAVSALPLLVLGDAFE